MTWVTAILSLLLIIMFGLYKRSLRDIMLMRSMYIMSVLNREFLEGQQSKMIEYLGALSANNALQVSQQFNRALDQMVDILGKDSPLLLGANAALWDAYKSAKQKQAP